MEVWAWGLIAIFVSAAIAGLTTLSARAVRAEAKEAVTGVQEDLNEVKVDLARNYVRHEDLVDLKKGNQLVLRKVTSIQILIARHFGLTTRDIGIREDDIEG